MAKLCKKCGALLAKDARSCAQCGEAVYTRGASDAAPPVTPAPPVRKKLTISEKKERKATRKAQKRKGNLILLIVDLLLLLLVLGCITLIMDTLGIIDIPFFGVTPDATEPLSNAARILR